MCDIQTNYLDEDKMPDELIIDAKKQHQDSVAYFQDERYKCVEDIRFGRIDSSQWNERHATEADDDPKFTVNRIVHSLNQISGAFKQTKISGIVKPVSGDGTKEGANLRRSLIRNIENTSQAQDIYNDNFDLIAAGGFGAWQVRNIFLQKSFDQDLEISNIVDPFYRLWPDAYSRDIMGYDWNYAFIDTMIHREVFKKRYPGMEMESVDSTSGDANTQWFTEDQVRITEYMVRNEVKKNLILMSSGEVFEETDENKDALDRIVNEGGRELDRRQITSHEVKMYKLSGLDVLEGPFNWPGEIIPIVPCYGYAMIIDNELRYNGKIRWARDPQEIYNYAVTANIVQTAINPRDPIFMTRTMTAGWDELYRDFNNNNDPIIYYDHDPDVPEGPKRLGAPVAQSNLIQVQIQSMNDVMATMGTFPTNLGDNPEDQSGVAIKNLRRQSDLGSVELTNSMVRSIKKTHHIILQVMPNIFDRERQLRVVDEEERDKVVTINEQVLDPKTKKPVILNDLTTGKYEIAIDIGPATETQNEEFLRHITALRQTDPDVAATSSDLVIDALSFHRSNALAKRVKRKMIKRGDIEPTKEDIEDMQREKEELGPQDNTQAKLQGALMKLKLENADLDMRLKKIEIAKGEAEVDLDRAKANAEIAKTAKTLQEAGIPITEQQLKIQNVSQLAQLLDLLNNQLPGNTKNSPELGTPQPQPTGGRSQ